MGSPIDPLSMQPGPPQNVVVGRFGGLAQNRKVWIVGAVILALVIWYFWRKRRSE